MAFLSSMDNPASQRMSALALALSSMALLCRALLCCPHDAMHWMFSYQFGSFWLDLRQGNEVVLVKSVTHSVIIFFRSKVHIYLARYEYGRPVYETFRTSPFTIMSRPSSCYDFPIVDVHYLYSCFIEVY